MCVIRYLHTVGMRSDPSYLKNPTHQSTFGHQEVRRTNNLDTNNRTRADYRYCVVRLPFLPSSTTVNHLPIGTRANRRYSVVCLSFFSSSAVVNHLLVRTRAGCRYPVVLTILNLFCSHLNAFLV